MKVLLRLTILLAVAAAALTVCGGKETQFTDTRDGKVYHIVKIDRQVWFAENLNFAAEGSKCYDNKAENCDKYGRLYNWETALKACPAGFHLPSDDEWTALVNYAGGEETAGTKLKSSTGWESEKGVPAGTNEYGFSALPGGYGGSDGYFFNAGNIGHWWSATEYYADHAWDRYMFYGSGNVSRNYNDETSLFSVRCVAD
jgi:uncharacterized protein (TIGR02145 family)